jgi:pimeloyl-ACP methyl ester carboxylesterase
MVPGSGVLGAAVRVQVGNVSLWFEVQGTRYTTGSDGLAEQPTVVLLHGGPGMDTGGALREQAATIAEFAQVVFFDQRGNGRSDRSSEDHWTLEQWADDVRGFCDQLEIERPIVIGGSFGGMVAQVYAGRHPEHPAAVGLLCTSMRTDRAAMIDAFRRVGGDDVAAVAEADFTDPSQETAEAFLEHCLPYYSTKPDVGSYLSQLMRRVIRTPDTEVAFSRTMKTMDLRSYVEQIRCPVLVLGGNDDPIMPRHLMDELADTLGDQLWRYVQLDNCGHMLRRDQPQQVDRHVRDFVLAHADTQPSQTPLET